MHSACEGGGGFCGGGGCSKACQLMLMICGILGKGSFFLFALYCFVFFTGYLSTDVCDILMIFKGKNI